MSVKIQAFRSAIQQPLTKRDITLWIPSLQEAALLVQSATFPTERFKSTVIKQYGQEIELPTKMQVSGDWSFTLPDGVFTLIRYRLLSLMYSRELFDVYQFLGTADVVLPTSIQSLYKLASMASSAMLTAQILRACWVRDIATVEFAANAPEQPVLWQITVHYNYITPFKGLL